MAVNIEHQKTLGMQWSFWDVIISIPYYSLVPVVLIFAYYEWHIKFE